MLKFPVLCLVAALFPATASALEPVRVVATGGRIGYTFYTPATANTSFRQRTPHKLGGPVEEIQIGFMDWMYTDNSAETPNATNEVTIEAAWLERDSTKQIVPLTFNGARQLVLPMNSTTPYWPADVIPSSVWTGSSPSKDEVFWLHVKGSIPTGGKTPVGTPTTFSGAKCVFYPPASDPGTIDTPNAIPTITGSASRTEGLPLVFLGRYTGPGHLAVIGIGDSILNGSGDTANPAPVISGYGFFNRAALDANGANTIATFNLTRHGQTASSWVNPARQTRQTPFLKFANVVVEEYGTNDLGSGGTGTPSTILANTEKIWTAARNAGVQKIIRTLLMPRTADPAYTWNNTSVQTPAPGWGAGEKRDTINDGFLAARTAGKVDVVLDTLAVMADPTDTHIWLTTGTDKYMTSDGTHVSPNGNALLAPHLRNALLSLTVDTNRPDYAAWSSAINWNGADSSPAADPKQIGLKNLLAYALDLAPQASPPAGSLPAASLDTTTAGGPWLNFLYRQNATAMDLQFIVETSDNLSTWTPAVADGTNVILETADGNVDQDGTAVLRRLRVKQPDAAGPRFARLKIRY